MPLRVLAELTNIGTLLAFVIVCAAVLIMRRRGPEAERPFRCPLVPLVPVLGIVFCLVWRFSLPAGKLAALDTLVATRLCGLLRLRQVSQRVGPDARPGNPGRLSLRVIAIE